MDCRVLLIGGPPGAGKTTLARAIAASLGWTTLTCDDIRFAVQGVTTAETHPALHNLLPHTEYFTNGPVEKLIANAIALQDALWPANFMARSLWRNSLVAAEAREKVSLSPAAKNYLSRFHTHSRFIG